MELERQKLPIPIRDVLSASLFITADNETQNA